MFRTLIPLRVAFCSNIICKCANSYIQIEAAGTCQTTTFAVVYHKILGMISLAMELLNQLPKKENLHKLGIIHLVSLHLQPKRRNTGKMRDLLVQVPTIVLSPIPDLWGIEVMIQGTRIWPIKVSRISREKKRRDKELWCRWWQDVQQSHQGLQDQSTRTEIRCRWWQDVQQSHQGLQDQSTRTEIRAYVSH